MSKIKFPHASGNSMSICAPSTNPSGDLELKLPATIGTAGQVLKNSDTAGTLEFGVPQRPYRNLIINGAMQIAQRGTSSTSTGYQTVDRWAMWGAGNNTDLTQTQHDLTSSDTGPWAEGFRKSFHILNAGQSGADAAEYVTMQYLIEAQDIANSGWDYTSASSYITLSFWVKSSVAQTFYPYVRSVDGTNQLYTWAIALSANTWTKITKTIPGNSNIQFDNDNGTGFMIQIPPYWGTNWTGTITQDQWGTYNSAVRTPDSTGTWWTTSSATFEITGIQLEVGDVATDFEHKSYGDELARCQRFYYRHVEGNNLVACLGFSSATNQVSGYIQFPTTMRATPSIDHTNGDNYYRLGAGNLGGDKYIDGAWALQGATDKSTRIYATPQSTLTAGEPGLVDTKNASAFIAFSAEL